MDAQMELKGAVRAQSKRLQVTAYNLTRGKLKIVRVFFKALGIDFKENVPASIEEKYPGNKELAEIIRQGDEDYKAGRTRTVKDLKDVWSIVK